MAIVKKRDVNGRTYYYDTERKRFATKLEFFEKTRRIVRRKDKRGRTYYYDTFKKRFAKKDKWKSFRVGVRVEKAELLQEELVLPEKKLVEKRVEDVIPKTEEGKEYFTSCRWGFQAFKNIETPDSINGVLAREKMGGSKTFFQALRQSYFMNPAVQSFFIKYGSDPEAFVSGSITYQVFYVDGDKRRPVYGTRRHLTWSENRDEILYLAGLE